MFRRKQPYVAPSEIQKLQRQINDLEAEHNQTKRTLEAVTRAYQYRVVQDGDVWKAYVVEWKDTGRWSFDRFEVPGRTFYGATKASAVKRLKTELLREISPSFDERTGKDGW